MKYTDKKLIRASQIAYFIINDDVIREARFTSYTLSELLEHSDTFKRSVYEDIINLSKTDNYTATTDSTKDEVLKHVSDPKTEQLIAEKFAIIEDIKIGEIGSWKVVSYVDNNQIGKKGTAGKLVDGTWVQYDFSSSGDGLAAMVFETGNGQAITAFRGSEGMDHPLKKWDDILTDWVVADGGLGMSDRDTTQQKSVYKYMEEYVLNLNYDDITLTGHSLGGNLAMHAAVSANEISPDKAGKISDVVSFDGPGFSDEYMSRHNDAISAINTGNTTLTHYIWSLVGSLFFKADFRNL